MKATSNNVMKGIFWSAVASAVWGSLVQRFNLFHKIKTSQLIGICRSEQWVQA